MPKSTRKRPGPAGDIHEEEEEGEERKANAPQDPWVIDRLQFKRDNTGYLTGNRKTHLYVFDVASKELRQLTSGAWDESLGVWSPDGTRIAFASTCAIILITG